ncbi:MAG: ABC transporter substrate-binding protein, partial [Chloroflexota bacterium]|nr:ABC transporter substrate-binding protein [Chloroflexota bacterium]
MLRRILYITLLLVLLAACAPQGTPTPTPIMTEDLATEAPATETPATEAPTETSAATPLTVTDGLGREVTLDAVPQRIVSLAPSNTEILFAIGAGNQVVGRDQLSDFPEEAKELPDIGSTFEELNTELIVSLDPDLVLAAEINTPEQVKQLEDLGLTVYYLKNPLTLEEMYGNLEIVAELTGREDEAAALIESLQARVAAVDEKIAPLSSRPGVFYELDATDPAKPFTAGKGTFIDQLIDRAGGFNIASDLEGYPQISLEQVVAADPAFIILGDARYGVTPESIAGRPGWGNLSAVKNEQVFPFNDDLVSRPGPRLVDALEELAKLLRP